MSNNKTFYLRNKSGSPVGCVAWFVDENIVSFTVSVCAKHDTFHKSLGRQIACNRLSNPSRINSFVINNSSNVMKEIMTVIAKGHALSSHDNLQTSSIFPQRAINSAREWLKK